MLSSVLVHSLDPLVYALPGAELRDFGANAELTGMEHDPKRHGANHDSVVQREQVCAEILNEVKRHSGSLLVLSSAGRTEAGSMALATMARLLLADTPCSILTIPTPAVSATLPRWMWQNVIAATDFSEAGIAALDIAQRIAGRGLVVLHSTQCGKEQQCSHCMTRLQLLAPFNESHTLPVEHLVASGAVTTAIASVARRVHPDLLVLGAPPVAIHSGHLDNSTIYTPSSSPTARCSWFHLGPAVITARLTKPFTHGWKQSGALTASHRRRASNRVETIAGVPRCW